MSATSTRLAVTQVGRAVAQSVLHPQTADQLLGYAAGRVADFLELLQDTNKRELMDFALLHAVYCSHEYSTSLGNERFLPYQLDVRVENAIADRAELHLVEQPWQRDLSAANGAMVAMRWARGGRRDRLAGEFERIGSGVLQSMFREGSEMLVAWSDCLGASTMGFLHEEERPVALRVGVEKLRGMRNLARSVRVLARSLSVGLPSEVAWIAGLKSEGTGRACLPRIAVVELMGRELREPGTLLRRDKYAELVGAVTAVGIPKADEAVKNLRRAVEEYRRKERERLWKAAIEQAVGPLRGILEQTIDARQSAFETKIEEMLDVAGIAYERLDDGSIPGAPDFCLGSDASEQIVVELKTAANDKDVGLNGATDVVKGAAIVGRSKVCKATLANPGFEPNVPWQVSNVEDLALVEACQFGYGISLVTRGEVTKGTFLDWLRIPGMVAVSQLRGLVTTVSE